MVSVADERPELAGVGIELVVAPDDRALSEAGIAEFSPRGFTKIAVWTPEAEIARSEFNRELETGPEEKEEEHEEEMMVADESASSEADERAMSEAGPE